MAKIGNGNHRGLFQWGVFKCKDVLLGPFGGTGWSYKPLLAVLALFLFSFFFVSPNEKWHSLNSVPAFSLWLLKVTWRVNQWTTGFWCPNGASAKWNSADPIGEMDCLSNICSLPVKPERCHFSFPLEQGEHALCTALEIVNHVAWEWECLKTLVFFGGFFLTRGSCTIARKSSVCKMSPSYVRKVISLKPPDGCAVFAAVVLTPQHSCSLHFQRKV